jgi:hypothetical protein
MNDHQRQVAQVIVAPLSVVSLVPIVFCFVLFKINAARGLKGLCRTKEKPNPVLVELTTCRGPPESPFPQSAVRKERIEKKKEKSTHKKPSPKRRERHLDGVQLIT